VLVLQTVDESQGCESAPLSEGAGKTDSGEARSQTVVGAYNGKHSPESQFVGMQKRGQFPVASNVKCYCGSGKKLRYCCEKPKTAEVLFNGAQNGKVAIVVTRNLLQNLVRRDINPVCVSFDTHYSDQLRSIDEVFSDAAFILFTSRKFEGNIAEDYEGALHGLLNNSLNTLGAAVVLLRSGLYKQAMVLIRQAVETSSTIIHIVGDTSRKALDDFLGNKYSSTKSLSKAKVAVPIIGEFWGFLSTSYVHVNAMNSFAQNVKPYKKDDKIIEHVFDCLRMATWIAYLSAEIAFPMTRAENRYWKPLVVGGKNAVAFAPDEQEREWAARFLDHDNVSADDISAGTDGGAINTS